MAGTGEAGGRESYCRPAFQHDAVCACANSWKPTGNPSLLKKEVRNRVLSCQKVGALFEVMRSTMCCTYIHCSCTSRFTQQPHHGGVRPQSVGARSPTLCIVQSPLEYAVVGASLVVSDKYPVLAPEMMLRSRCCNRCLPMPWLQWFAAVCLSHFLVFAYHLAFFRNIRRLARHDFSDSSRHICHFAIPRMMLHV